MFKLNIKHVISFLSLSLFMFLAIGSGSDNEGVEEDISGKSTEVTTTADEMYQAYDENEAGAELKYKDKVIEISGIVKKVTTNSFDENEITVKLKAGGYSSIDCDFSAKHKAEAATLKEGDKVKIKGLGAKKVVYPTLKGCSIVK